MSNTVIQTQIFPECNTTTKFNVDLFNQRFLINDLGFDFSTFKDKPFSRQYLQFIDVKNYTIDSYHRYFDCIFDDELEQYVFNHIYNTPLNLNLSNQKFKSYAIIDNQYYYAPHNGRIWRYTIDGNLLPQYSPKTEIDNYHNFIFLKQIGDYLIWFVNNTYDSNTGSSSFFYLHHKHDCRNYTRIAIDDSRYSVLVDFDDELNQITILKSIHYNSELSYYILKIPETPDDTITTIEKSNSSRYLFASVNNVVSKVFNCDSLYDLGIYGIFGDTLRLQLMNIDKVNKVIARYDVNVDWNGFTFDSTNMSKSYVSNRYDSEITLGLMFNDSHFDLYRIRLTSDLEGVCIAKTTFNLNSDSYDHNFQKLEFKNNKLVAVTDLKTTIIIKYIPEFNTFVEIKSFSNEYLTFYNLKQNQILIGELQYSSIHINEIIFDSEMRLFIKDYPENIPKNESGIITFGLYDIVYEEYVANTTIFFELTDGAVFRANGKNKLEFLSQDHISSVEIKTLDESKAVELYYSI